MRCQRNFWIFAILSIISISILWGAHFFVFAATPTGQIINIPGQITITSAVTGCGDGVIQTGESCDGANLNLQTCFSQGFFGGTLSCNLDCTFNRTACVLAPPPPVGVGVGVGIIAPVTQVIFSGRAYPRSTVTLLKDAQIAAITVADANANFQISISGISAGNYIFSVYSEDNRGIRSSLLTFPVGVTAGVTTRVGGIFIAPTITTDRSEVRRGDNIAIFGQSAPNSEITIAVHSDEEFFMKTAADEDGVYLYNFDTSPLRMGQHSARSKAAHDGRISSFGKSIGFLVGRRNVARVADVLLRGDLNADGRVNLIDFSIAAFWHRRTISAEFAVRERERLNGDGRVDLVDFSIMAFYWTG